MTILSNTRGGLANDRFSVRMDVQQLITPVAYMPIVNITSYGVGLFKSTPVKRYGILYET